MTKYACKLWSPVLSVLMVFSVFLSCYEDQDDNLVPVTVELEIKDYIWKAMNNVYLYKAEIPDLADDRFSSDEEYTAYLNMFSSPEALFESLLYMRQTVDRFSYITDDYVQLEQSQDGISKAIGIRFATVPDPQDANQIHILVLQVINDSPADNLGIQRGMFISTIDGAELNESNIGTLLAPDTYTLGFGMYDTKDTQTVSDDTINITGDSVTLSKEVITENPVLRAEIVEVAGEKIGYLAYSRFNNNFDKQLNNAFGFFKENNIQNLVLDLRYNPGGFISTATYLGSMITGQFDGEVYTKLVYNEELQENNEDFRFVSSFPDGTPINSLGLDKVYVLTTYNSASASELTINSLEEYIDVIQIGTSTRGKTQASIPIYDSPDGTRDDRNPRHTYVIQPLIANAVDKNGNAVPGTGLVPDIEINEIPENYLIFDFADPNEILFATAISEITGSSRIRGNFDAIRDLIIDDFSDSSQDQGLFLEKVSVPTKSLFGIE